MKNDERHWRPWPILMLRQQQRLRRRHRKRIPLYSGFVVFGRFPMLCGIRITRRICSENPEVVVLLTGLTDMKSNTEVNNRDILARFLLAALAEILRKNFLYSMNIFNCN